MKLDIANQAELEAACKAVEELRSREIRHVGRFAKMYEFPCEQSTRERALAEGWARANEKYFGLNNGHGVLEHLLCSGANFRFFRDLKPEEATAAATAIQWLGTNCGFDNLCEWLKTAGYEVRKIENEFQKGGL